MSKMSDLDLVLQELRKCGEGLVRVSEELAGIFSGSGEADAQEGKPKAAKKKPEKAAAAVQESEKQYSLAEVRALLAEKSKAGYTAEVREMLQRHGAEKLSGIDPSEYAALVAEVEVLGNG